MCILAVMNITHDTTPQEIWAYHLELLRPFRDMVENGKISDLSRLLKAFVDLQVHVDAQAKHYVDESWRRGIELKAAEAWISELEREVERLQHYAEVVEQALADAAE